MFAAYVTVVISTMIVNAGAAAADFVHAPFVLANSAEVGVAERWLPLLGTLKAAGVAGLLVGLVWERPIGVAAAIGLVAFFIGAIATHIRARVLYNLAFPGFYLALAVGTLVL
ncbi:MAG TPA: DoxX family protein, partial [Solirubrobacteraceae bacterium]|nr:DoxX family protein [Solirubrobacteraceae bacterium]